MRTASLVSGFALALVAAMALMPGTSAYAQQMGGMSSSTTVVPSYPGVQTPQGQLPAYGNIQTTPSLPSGAGMGPAYTYPQTGYVQPTLPSQQPGAMMAPAVPGQPVGVGTGISTGSTVTTEQYSQTGVGAPLAAQPAPVGAGPAISPQAAPVGAGPAINPQQQQLNCVCSPVAGQQGAGIGAGPAVVPQPSAAPISNEACPAIYGQPAGLGAGPVPTLQGVTGPSFDTEFLRSMYQHNSDIAAVAAVGAQKASDPRLRDLSAKIERERLDMNQSFLNWYPVLGNRGTLLSTTTGADNIIAGLSGLSGADFDRQYSDAMIGLLRQSMDANSLGASRLSTPDLITMTRRDIRIDQNEINALGVFA